ncbi:MAG: putative acetyltransferase [Candidatus Latescibacterota bacterium]|jgi:predicted acetyltransferase
MIPEEIPYEDIVIRLDGISQADYTIGYVPSHNFGIYLANTDIKVGQIGFRIGISELLKKYAGQVGYGVEEAHRGNGYAAKALCALRKHVSLYLPHVYITCTPSNVASARTIEKAGGVLQEVVDVPKGNPAYEAEEPKKNVYILDLSQERANWKVEEQT